MANPFVAGRCVVDLIEKKATYVRNMYRETFLHLCENAKIVPSGGAFCFDERGIAVGQYFYL